MAASAVNTSRELGAVTGVTVLGAIINGQLTTNLHPPARVDPRPARLLSATWSSSSVTTGATNTLEAAEERPDRQHRQRGAGCRAKILLRRPNMVMILAGAS